MYLKRNDAYVTVLSGKMYIYYLKIKKNVFKIICYNNKPFMITFNR